MKGKSFSGMLYPVVFLAMCSFLLSACGIEAEGSSTKITKDDTIESKIVEQFDKPYYDIEELQQNILEEAAYFNREAGQSAISVEKIEEKDGFVMVEMTYDNAEDFAKFNDMTFFVGKPMDAVQSGYDLNKVLSSVSNSLETVGLSDILAMDDVLILITDTRDPVILNGKASYISSNVTTDKKCKTLFFDEESESLSYIIYKLNVLSRKEWR